ncbi:MAG: hypothetical protein O3B73_18380, partial [bacterium]|nr:hypothetical protein [bacterium]
RSGETNGYLLVKMGASRGHYDPDEGSILWYAWGKPVLADFGCQYNPNIECAWLHNRISFDHWNEAGGRAFDARVSDIGPFATMISGSMRVTQLHRWADRPIRAADFDFRSLPDPHAIPPVTWRREVLYIRACEAVLIRDQIDGDHPTDWNLQVFADAIEVKGNHAACRGQFGVDLDVYMGQPEEVAWSIGSFEHIGFDEPRLPAPWWRGAAWTAPEGAIYGPVGERALSLHLPSARRSEYVALLIARPQACRPPTVKPFRDGFSWQTPRASWRAVLTDGSWQIHASQTT